MRRILWNLGCISLLGISAAAQTPATSASQFVIDQPAPDLATAQSYTYRIYTDGAASGIPITMTCSGTTSPFTCVGPLGAFTPGPHSVTFTAANAAGESPRSEAVSFTMVLIPARPENPRIR